MSIRLTIMLTGFLPWSGLLACSISTLAAQQTVDQPNDQTVFEKIIKLETGPLFRPIFFPEQSGHAVTTSVELKGRVPAQGEGAATFTFGTNHYRYNDFGDPELTEAGPEVERKVVIREARHDSGEELRDFWRARRWYELVFDNKKYNKRFYLVLSGGAARHHQLLVRPAPENLENQEPAASGWRRNTGLTHVLNLQGEPSPRLVLGDRKFGGTGSWTTAMPANDQPNSYLYNTDVSIYQYRQADFTTADITIWTPPHTIARFPYINGYGGPAVAGTRFSGRLQQVSQDDPKKAGRVLYELIPGRMFEAILSHRFPPGNKRYRFVFTPTTAGPHRMLLYQGDELKHCLPLDDEREETQRVKQLQMQNAPQPQQQAMAELREHLAGKYHYNVEEDAVEYLSIFHADDMACVNRALAKLPGLQDVVLTSCELDREPLKNLARLKQLKSLRLEDCTVSPELLASVAEAPNIQALTLNACQSLDEACLAQVGQAKSLEYLCLRSMLVTDAALMQLGQLESLKRLSLIKTGGRLATVKAELQTRIPGLIIDP